MSTSGKVALYKNLAQNANGAEAAKPRYLRSGVYDGGPIIEKGGPIFLYKRVILEGSTSLCEGIRTGLSCQTGVAKHQVNHL